MELDSPVPFSPPLHTSTSSLCSLSPSLIPGTLWIFTHYFPSPRQHFTLTPPHQMQRKQLVGHPLIIGYAVSPPELTSSLITLPPMAFPTLLPSLECTLCSQKALTLVSLCITTVGATFTELALSLSSPRETQAEPSWRPSHNIIDTA